MNINDYDPYYSILPLDEAEELMTEAVLNTVTDITDETGEQIDENDIWIKLADSDWIYIVCNPDDAEDDRDFVDMSIVCSTLNDIREQMIRDIEEEQEEHQAKTATPKARMPK